MKYLFTVLLSLLLSVHCFGQQLYITNRVDIIKITLTDATHYKSQPLKRKENPDFVSIAIYKNTLYFNDFSFLYKAIIKKDSLINITRIAPVDYYPTSLTVDVSGTLYFAVHKTLYRCSPFGSPTKLGEMPYESAGDLVFYKGNLYMASQEGIVKVNIANPAESILYMTNVSGNILALTSVAVDCNTNKVYGLEAVINDTRFLEIDLDKKTVTASPYYLPIHSSDAASSAETGAVAGINIDTIEILPICGTSKSKIQIQSSPVSTQYTYALEGTTNKTGYFTDLLPGRYVFSVSTAGGCSKDSFVVVPDFNVKPVHEVKTIDPICENDGTIDVRLNDSKFRIVLGTDTLGSAHVFEKLPAKKYSFSIINRYNCEVDQFSVQLNQSGPCGLIQYPTAFTPNSDGINDYFVAPYNVVAKNYIMQIYTRWGIKLFTTRKINEGWDGTASGKPLPPGTYYWIVSYVTDKGETKHQSGFICLMR